VLCFIELGTRRVHLAAVTANPDGTWVAQQARNLRLVLGERGRRVRFLVRDREAKFTRVFDDVFGSDGAEVLITPVQAQRQRQRLRRALDPDVRAECLDWLLITGPEPLAQMLGSYVERDNRHRPHRTLQLKSPDARPIQSSVRSSARLLHHRDQAMSWRSLSGQDCLVIAPGGIFQGQAVAGRLLFRRRRGPGVAAAAVVDPGLRPRFFSVLPTLCNPRSR
jgi:hypothetical protein